MNKVDAIVRKYEWCLILALAFEVLAKALTLSHAEVGEAIWDSLDS